MTHPSSETSQSFPTPFEHSKGARVRSERPGVLVRRLDFFLSESLRNAQPSDVVRHRVLVGAACFLFLFTAVYVTSSLVSPYPALPGTLAALGYVATLLAARRATTVAIPATIFLASLLVGFVGSTFADPRNFEGGVHATNMLLPALAVYLLGSRRGLLYTLLFAGVMAGLHPLYRTCIGLPEWPLTLAQYWWLHVFAGLSFVGAWGLGSLHSTARQEAQVSLEHALKKLRGSERKLNSIIESTDDVVVAMDTEGRVLVANPAAMQFHQRLFGAALELGKPLFGHTPPEVLEVWKARLAQVARGQRLRIEEPYELGGSPIVMDLSLHPILAEGGQTVGVTLFGRDITARKAAESRLGEMHRSLVDASRQAGMAEVATGVLHNVGNTLNSVNISVTLVTDRLRQSRVTGLAKAAELLRAHSGDVASFIAREPQGQMLPAYLIAVSQQLTEEREVLLKEMYSLGQGVEHIKSIVSMQQKHARSAGAVEQVAVPQLIDEALRLHAVSFERLAIRIVRDYADVPLIFVDRHKLLQILINLLSNARHALVDSSQRDKRLLLQVRRAPESGRLLIEVTDNGVGIPPEILARLFTQGFTTKKTGHGFGLHISALSATEMRGRLTCSSPGPGLGATFTLELPIEREDFSQDA